METNANGMAPSSSTIWRKRLLALFVALAVSGLVVGLIGAFEPGVFQPSSKVQKASAAATTVTPLPPSKEIKAPAKITPIEAEPAAPIPEVPTTDAATVTTTVETPLESAPEPTTTVQSGGLFTGISALSQQKEAVFNTLVKVTSVAGASSMRGDACVPQDGLELRAMLEDTSSCTIITLRPGVTYATSLPDADDDISIAARKVVIGNPIRLPTIDGSMSRRIFRIVAGGSLDLQFVRTYRGGGELIYTLPVLRGGTALVQLGGRFNAFGCIFTNAPPAGAPAALIAPDISRAVRVFGGQIFNAGGVMTITLSHFWVLQPGVLLREIYIVGADVLTVAGVTVLSGCTFTNSQLFLNGFGVGFQLAHIGGVVIASGVTFTINCLAINASGAGILAFIGGGVGIFSGVSWNANVGVLSHFGSGFMLFNGGGVLVVSGAAFSAHAGVAIECGTGVMISMGGGTLTATGVTQELSVGVDFYAGAGVFNWVGAGSAVLTAFTAARNVAVAGVYGIGGSMALGAGDLVVVGSANADDYGIIGLVLVGGDWFVGAGIMVDIASPFTKNVGLLWATFVGIDGFVGAGAAIIAASPSFINVGKGWINPNAAMYHVNGARVSTTLKSFRVGKDGVAQPLKTRALPEVAAINATAVEITPQAALNVLQGSNKINSGTPSPFVAKIQASAVGKGMRPLDVAYASVNGASLCNTCGFRGDVSQEFIGDAAAACTPSEATAVCDLAHVKVAGSDGAATSLPQWMLTAAGTYNGLSGDAAATAPLDTQVITAVLRLGCSGVAAGEPQGEAGAAAVCLPAERIADVVKASLDDDCARVHIAARDMTKHPELAADTPRTTEPMQHVPHTSAYDLTFSTHDGSCTNAVTTWIKGNDAAALLEQLQATAPQTAQLEAVDVAMGPIHNVPGLSLSGANQEAVGAIIEAAAASGLPTVLVTPAAASSTKNPVGRLALPSIGAGQTGQVTLSGFSAQQPVALEMTNRCVLGARDEAVSVGSFTPPANSTPAGGGAAAVSVPITVPIGIEQGTYSIRATQNGLSWCSQPVEVVSA